MAALSRVSFSPANAKTTPKTSNLLKMKTLLVLRDAKSSWNDKALDDH